MKLNSEEIKNNRKNWEEKGFTLPSYDIAAVAEKTVSAPEWLHIGPGNIFRAYIARIADDLIESGGMSCGITAADCFDDEISGKVFRPFDNLTLIVGLGADGKKHLRIAGSIGNVVDDDKKLRETAASPTLKMISFTITEKGYTGGNADDIANGPHGILSSAMGKTAALLYERFEAGAYPVAMVSMDNCSENGDKLRAGVLSIADGWKAEGFVGGDFIDYLNDRSKVSFPCSMIDKITPRPDPEIGKMLESLGIEDMKPIVTTRGTYAAPFVNAEMPQYLVIEDDFPNGRPPLEKAGVYLTDRATVEKAERMKVMTCLNPLHTALAVFGCLLGYKKISDEMNDPDLKKLVCGLGYAEGLPVSADPGIIKPEDFLKEVIEERLCNASLPDTPQRIATDTSQKVSIRFGGTVKAYAAKGETDKLELIPLVIAGWLRYLFGTDDSGKKNELSSDPMLGELTARMGTISNGGSGFSAEDRQTINSVLSDSGIFGLDLVKAGLSDKIVTFLEKMTKGAGTVRAVLSETVSPYEKYTAVH